MINIGILHPGEMGVSVAASAIQTGNIVRWVSHKRSEKTRSRAQKHGLIEVQSLSQLCASSEIIFSVCPPNAAKDVAKSVVENDFKGLYLDANAIAPQRVARIGEMMDANGVQFVDGGIIGGPAWKLKETVLYLSGKDASKIAVCFSGGFLDAKVIGTDIGKASALKMCYAAYSKGTTALLAGILAAAESLGVRDELCTQWDMDDSGFVKQVEGRVMRVTAKAWRFEGEMREIASTLHHAGIPSGFHEAAAQIYNRIAHYKDQEQAPSLNDILADLRRNADN